MNPFYESYSRFQRASGIRNLLLLLIMDLRQEHLLMIVDGRVTRGRLRRLRPHHIMDIGGVASLKRQLL
jgi:hypothetical protein